MNGNEMMSSKMSLQIVCIWICVFAYVTIQNVTEYHAAIDGASQKLIEKTERLSLADRDLVQRADEHAEELENQANQLEE